MQFAAKDAVADERVRHIELHRERVVVRRRSPACAWRSICRSGLRRRHQGPRARTACRRRDRRSEHKDFAGGAAVFASAEIDDTYRLAFVGERAGVHSAGRRRGRLARAFERMGGVLISRPPAPPPPQHHQAPPCRCRCAAAPARSPATGLSRRARDHRETNRYLQRCKPDMPPGCMFNSYDRRRLGAAYISRFRCEPGPW